MKLSVLQQNLSQGLGVVTRAVESRPNLPVLGNVLLESDDARLKLAALNMSLGMGITCWIGAKIEQPGKITLPARTLADLVNNLSQERVDLTLDSATQSVHLKCGGTSSNIKGIDADEFPPVPQGGGGDVMVQGKVLRDMINQTVFAASTKEDRPVLTGVYTRLEGNVMTMAAADGYRLAVRTTELEQDFENPVEMVIPGKAIAEVARIISDEDSEVLITLPDNRDVVMFHMKNVDVSTQLLDGKFPDFSAIIPQGYSTSMVVYTSDLLRACQRAEIFARDNAYNGNFRIKPPKGPGEPGEILVKSTSAERGDNEGIVDASIEGEELEISFNIKYLIDVLRVVPNERIRIESNGASHPGVIRPEERDDFIHVIMPMSVTR